MLLNKYMNLTNEIINQAFGLNKDLIPTFLSTLANQSYADESGYSKIKFRVPGYEKSEIKLSVEKGQHGKKILNIRAENKEFGVLKISEILNSSVDESSIKASLKNGILTVSCATSNKTIAIDVE
jgi:HSP20 family molecular chaperone IbpA